MYPRPYYVELAVRTGRVTGFRNAPYGRMARIEMSCGHHFEAPEALTHSHPFQYPCTENPCARVRLHILRGNA